MSRTSLAVIREQRGLSQAELARRTGIQPGLICRYEKGQLPNQTNAQRIAKALGHRPTDVFPEFAALRPY